MALLDDEWFCRALGARTSRPLRVPRPGTASGTPAHPESAVLTKPAKGAQPALPWQSRGRAASTCPSSDRPRAEVPRYKCLVGLSGSASTWRVPAHLRRRSALETHGYLRVAAL